MVLSQVIYSSYLLQSKLQATFHKNKKNVYILLMLAVNYISNHLSQYAATLGCIRGMHYQVISIVQQIQIFNNI